LEERKRKVELEEELSEERMEMAKRRSVNVQQQDDNTQLRPERKNYGLVLGPY